MAIVSTFLAEPLSLESPLPVHPLRASTAAAATAAIAIFEVFDEKIVEIDIDTSLLTESGRSKNGTDPALGYNNYTMIRCVRDVSGGTLVTLLQPKLN